MGAARRRYTAREFTDLGPTTPVSVRIPDSVIEQLDAEIAKGKPGITNRTDAVQDAVVVWLILEQTGDTHD